MGSLIIDGTTYEDVAKAFNPPNGLEIGSYYLLDPWGHPPRLGAEEYEIMHVPFPGVDGVWRKNMGYRGRAIHIQMATVNYTKDDTWSDVSDLFDKFAKFERYTVTLPDSIELEGVALIPGGGSIMDEFAVGGPVGKNAVIVLTSWQFRQYSYGNA